MSMYETFCKSFYWYLLQVLMIAVIAVVIIWVPAKAAYGKKQKRDLAEKYEEYVNMNLHPDQAEFVKKARNALVGPSRLFNDRFPYEHCLLELYKIQNRLNEIMDKHSAARVDLVNELAKIDLNNFSGLCRHHSCKMSWDYDEAQKKVLMTIVKHHHSKSYTTTLTWSADGK